MAVKGNSVNLAVMPLESMKAPSFRNTPDSGRGIVTTRYDDITLDLQTSDTRLMSNKNIAAVACPDVPNPKRGIPGS